MQSTEAEDQPMALPAPAEAVEDLPPDVDIPDDAEVEDGPAGTTLPAIAQWYTLKHFDLVRSKDGRAYAVDRNTANPTAYRVASPGFMKVIRRLVYVENPKLVLKTEHLNEVVSQLEALAELKGELASVWLRVAKTATGIEIDIGDDTQARIAVDPGKVAVLTEGSSNLFERNPNFLPFVYPADQGDLNKLMRYLNLTDEEKWLLIGWITYTQALPKVPESNYVILALRGEQGAGKSTMSNVIIGSLVGPSVLGVQAFPANPVDMAIAVQNSHVVLYDNLRELTPSQADNLCRCSTAATLSTRALYTNGQEYTHTLHGAVVLNGIHAYIVQPDVFQRSLCLTLQTMPRKDRATEKQLRAKFQQDLPAIFRGALNLIADIMTHLPNVTAMYPERMLEFVHWLAAMEKALNFPEGQLQKTYSDNLIGAMRDTLQDSPLADAVLQFAQQQSQATWTGTPGELLLKLGQFVPAQIITTTEWPQNEIALSKRLKTLKSQLSGAGVDVVLGRRLKKRQISITYTGRSS